jgi:hypothetical protein
MLNPLFCCSFYPSMTYAVGDIGRYPPVAARLLPLNNQSARETSLLDAAKFARMIAAARVATIVWPNVAFLLAFDQARRRLRQSELPLVPRTVRQFPVCPSRHRLEGSPARRAGPPAV